MFGKSDQARVTETLAVIQTAPVAPIDAALDVSSVGRGLVCSWLANLYPRLLPSDQQAFHELSQSLSVKANIARNVAKGDERQRAKRRAIFLLWKAIGKAQNADDYTSPRAAEAMTLPPASLDAAFGEVMLKAATVATPAGAREVMQKLETHPVPFLSRHSLQIVGSLQGHDRFSSAPDNTYRNVVRYHLQYQPGVPDQFVMSETIDARNGAAHAFDAVCVPALHWTEVPNVGRGPPYNFTGILGCEVAGADFMLTTTFTGCAFSWTDHQGVLRASHISPAGGGTGTYPGGGKALAQELMARGAMANAPGQRLTVLGAGAGNAPVATGNPYYPDPRNFRWVAIIGVRQGGGAWEFYAHVAADFAGLALARQIL